MGESKRPTAIISYNLDFEQKTVFNGELASISGGMSYYLKIINTEIEFDERKKINRWLAEASSSKHQIIYKPRYLFGPRDGGLLLF